MQSKSDMGLSNWIAADFLKQAPSLMADYKTVGSQHPENSYYLENVRRYIADSSYWIYVIHLPIIILLQAWLSRHDWPALVKFGLVVGIVQAATSVNEQTLSFVPKLVVTALVLVLFGASMLGLIGDFTTEIFTRIADTSR